MMKENVLQIKEEPPVEGLMTFDELVHICVLEP